MTGTPSPLSTQSHAIDTAVSLAAHGSKPKFRARKLEPNKLIRVLRWDELEDEDEEELAGAMRGVGMIVTGVDKEEEEEHHLQAALTTAMVASKGSSGYVIPTPDVQQIVSDYELLYPSGSFKLPKQFLRADIGKSQGLMSALTVDDQTLPPPTERPAKYNADANDRDLCRELQIDVDTFEVVMECLDLISIKLSQSHATVDAVRSMLPWLPLDNIRMVRVIEWWRGRAKGAPVQARLRHIDTGKIGADPYVCFRRRELRAPRKTRRSDAQCVDRLRKLRYELDAIGAALQAMVLRDKWRLEAVLLEGELFSVYLDNGHLISRLPRDIQSFKQAIAQPDVATSVPAVPGDAAGRKRKRRGEPAAALQPSTSQRYKISLPMAAFKSLKYSRPYYPVEMLKMLQKDMDAIQQQLEPGYEDMLPGLWTNDAYRDEQDVLYYRRVSSDLPAGISHGSNGQVIRARRGRTGRLLLDLESDAQSVLLKSDYQPSMDLSGIHNRLSLLGLRECSLLANPAVGNYNHHYIQTAQISRPHSFFTWLAATGQLQTAAASSSTGQKRSRGASPSKKPRQNVSSGPDTPSQPSTGQSQSTQKSPPSGIGNITVKVKKSAATHPSPTSPTDSTQPLAPSNAQSQHNNKTTRFTPNGLSPGNE